MIIVNSNYLSKKRLRVIPLLNSFAFPPLKGSIKYKNIYSPLIRLIKREKIEDLVSNEGVD